MKLFNGEIILYSIENEGSIFMFCLFIFGLVKKFLIEKLFLIEIENKEENKEIDLKNKYISIIIFDEIEDDRNIIFEENKVILIVEDDINFVKLLLIFSRNKGYKGVVVVRGDYVLNFVLKYKLIGILLDIEFFVKSGWEILEEFKNDLYIKYILVYIMLLYKLR